MEGSALLCVLSFVIAMSSPINLDRNIGNIMIIAQQRKQELFCYEIT